MQLGEHKTKIHGAVFDRPGVECSAGDIAKKGVFTIIGDNPTMGNTHKIDFNE